MAFQLQYLRRCRGERKAKQSVIFQPNEVNEVDQDVNETNGTQDIINCKENCLCFSTKISLNTKITLGVHYYCNTAVE